jgi:prevent-host-death family protein
MTAVTAVSVADARSDLAELLNRVAYGKERLVITRHGREQDRVLPLMPDPVRRFYARDRPIELRPVEYARDLGKKFEHGRYNVWILTTGRLPDAVPIHHCVLDYASDMMLLDAGNAASWQQLRSELGL